MKKKIRYNYTLNYLLFFITVMSFAQNSEHKNIIDSLSRLTYKEIENIYHEAPNDSLRISLHMKAFMLKAKQNNDSMRIANAFYNKAVSNNNENEASKFYDSSLVYSVNLKNKNFPSITYVGLAIEEYNKRNYKTALNYYLLAKKHNHGDGKIHLKFTINKSIARLKNRIGYDEEALFLYRKCLNDTKKQSFRESYIPSDHYKYHYSSILFSIAHSYRKINKLDSAYHYNSKGLKIASKKAYKTLYHILVMNDGIINYHKKNYTKSYDSIIKGLDYLTSVDNKPNIAVGNYYLGKLNMEFNKVDEAMGNFKKVDTIFQLNNDILPECRESYIYLSNYYRDKKDFANQLLYTERLLKVDSVLTDNYTFLSKKINHEYDRQNLLSEKQSLIQKINGEKNNYFNIIIGVIAIASILVFVLIYFIKKNKEKKTRLETLLRKLDTKKEDTNLKKENKTAAIKDAILKDIELKLQCFELNKQFTDSNLSVNSLASDFKTNSNYLSKTVNQLKGKNFSNYINELRIEHAINRLKNEPNFKKYTIRAIAEDVGFNTAQSFSTAFYKSTGIKPSYFIKNI